MTAARLGALLALLAAATYAASVFLGGLLDVSAAVSR